MAISTRIGLLLMLLVSSVAPYTHHRIKRQENGPSSKSQNSDNGAISRSQDGTVELFIGADNKGQNIDAPLTDQHKRENIVEEDQHGSEKSGSENQPGSPSEQRPENRATENGDGVHSNARTLQDGSSHTRHMGMRHVFHFKASLNYKQGLLSLVHRMNGEKITFFG